MAWPWQDPEGVAMGGIITLFAYIPGIMPCSLSLSKIVSSFPSLLKSIPLFTLPLLAAYGLCQSIIPGAVLATWIQLTPSSVPIK
eukprot:1153778-Pelagomonas_calceolata.AAC.3